MDTELRKTQYQIEYCNDSKSYVVVDMSQKEQANSQQNYVIASGVRTKAIGLFIVRACNNYDKMLAAYKNILCIANKALQQKYVAAPHEIQRGIAINRICNIAERAIVRAEATRIREERRDSCVKENA